MERKSEEKGISGDHRIDDTEDAAEINERCGSATKCCGSECHFEWTDD